MKLNSSQAAPTFHVKDVNGTTVNLSEYRGKKVLLSFYRNVGCPVCNLRFHELQNEAGYFKERQVILLSVYESSAENMKQYLDDYSGKPDPPIPVSVDPPLGDEI